MLRVHGVTFRDRLLATLERLRPALHEPGVLIVGSDVLNPLQPHAAWTPPRDRASPRAASSATAQSAPSGWHAGSLALLPFDGCS
jgi:hypothetical protein